MSLNILINIKTKMEKQILIYKLEGIDPKNGVDIFEIIPTLENLGLLIKEAGKTSLAVGDFEVKVKPFKEGSFEIDLLLKASTNLFSSNEVSAVVNLCELLAVVIGVIRFVSGKVNQFRKNNNKIIYYAEDGTEREVDSKTHNLIQNEIIQSAINGSITVPLKNIKEVDGVSLQAENSNAKILIDKNEVGILENYNNAEIEDDSKNIENESIVYLKPARGSYSGEEKKYTFISGKDSRLYPTTIQDENFIAKLKSGEIRLFHEDLLLVKLLSKQKISKKNGSLNNDYIIKEVLEYNSSFDKPEQSSFKI